MEFRRRVEGVPSIVHVEVEGRRGLSVYALIGSGLERHCCCLREAEADAKVFQSSANLRQRTVDLGGEP